MDERPLTARSVLASLLLGTEPPWLPTPRLVRGAALFGLAEGTVRTALSRMAANGEVVADENGYRLAGRLLARQQRQGRSRRAETRAWDGSWRMAVVSPGARTAADRAALRSAVGALRLGELREGCFLRPDNLVEPGPIAEVEVVHAQCRWLAVLPDDEAAALAASLWDLDGWATGAAALVDRLDAGHALLGREGTGALASGFVLSASILRHLQHDPLLPGTLLPDDWPGPGLRRAYDAFDARYRAVLVGWLRA